MFPSSLKSSGIETLDDWNSEAWLMDIIYSKYRSRKMPGENKTITC